MPRYLHVDYAQAQYWAHPLRAALKAKASLQQRDQHWRTSSHSDLAFSITTRIGAVQELVQMIDSALQALGAELADASDLDHLIAGGCAYSFADDPAVRRSLLLLTMFVAEGESLFENLVEFYRRFLDHYFGDRLDLNTAEARVTAFSNPTPWRGELNKLRNTTRHRFAPWLAFEDTGPETRPRWEPIVVHDWRPERLESTTSTGLGHLREIKAGLSQSAHGVLRDLVERVKAAP